MLPVNKQKIGVNIFLSIVTFGVFRMYWEYLLVKNVRAIKNDQSSCTGEVLCLLFVPYYPIYWWYTRGKTVRTIFTEQRYAVKGSEILYLILAVFGLEIISAAIMQSDFNSSPLPSEPKSVRTTRKWLEWVISLLITLAMLGLVVAGMFLYMDKTGVLIDMKGMWIGNAVGGIIMLFIIHHFVKEPEEEKS